MWLHSALQSVSVVNSSLNTSFKRELGMIKHPTALKLSHVSQHLSSAPMKASQTTAVMAHLCCLVVQTEMLHWRTSSLVSLATSIYPSHPHKVFFIFLVFSFQSWDSEGCYYDHDDSRQQSFTCHLSTSFLWNHKRVRQILALFGRLSLSLWTTDLWIWKAIKRKMTGHVVLWSCPVPSLWHKLKV